ncbi:MAG: hypothetical protein ACK4SN_04175 [Bellilinea sp.]
MNPVFSSYFEENDPAQAFVRPNTIPAGWDMTDFLMKSHPHTPAAEMNGTAFEQHLRQSVNEYEPPKNVV